MGYLPMISSLTYFVALDQGFFEDEGVEIIGVPMKTSNAIADALEAGTIEVGVELSVVPLLNKVSSGTPTSFLIFSTSAIAKQSGFDGVVVGGDSTISSLAELSGKKVAVFPGTTATNTLLDVFEQAYPGVPPPIPMAMLPTLHLPEVSNGGVDAAHAYEPFLSTGLVKQGMKHIHTSLYAEQVNPSPIGVAAINRNFFEQDGDRADHILRALDKAVDFIQDYPDKTRMIVSEYTGVDPEVADVINFMPMSKSTDIDVSGLEQYSSVLLKMGEIKKAPPMKAVCLGERQ
jgi:NitT/TauT family transport system substrate-binding protein